MWAVEEGTGGGGASLDDRCPTGRPGEVAENEPLRGFTRDKIGGKVCRLLIDS